MGLALVSSVILCHISLSTLSEIIRKLSGFKRAVSGLHVSLMCPLYYTEGGCVFLCVFYRVKDVSDLWQESGHAVQLFSEQYGTRRERSIESIAAHTHFGTHTLRHASRACQSRSHTDTNRTLIICPKVCGHLNISLCNWWGPYSNSFTLDLGTLL